MSYDGLFIHGLIQELNACLAGGRISKLQQPYDQEILLTVRSNRKNYKLLLAATPQAPRVQLTNHQYSVPDTPPNFCMFLRKHIDGGKIINFSQYENDRIIIISIESKNELGISEPYKLIIEVMGRRSNILVLNQDGKIADLITKIDISQNRFRTLLPGATYHLPPQGDKVNPFSINPNEYDLKADAKEIQKTFMGFGKDSAIELAQRLTESQDKSATFTAFLNAFDQSQPTLSQNDGQVTATAFPYQSLGGKQSSYETFTQLLDDYYEKKALFSRVNQVSEQISQVVAQRIKHNQRKLANLKQDMEKSKQAEDYQLKGEILTTYLFQVEKGMSSIQLPNYYDNNKPIEIALDPLLEPSQNAQKYFQRYRKLDTAKRHIKEQSQIAQAELDYLESVQDQIEIAEPNELEDIRQELIREGYIKQQKHNHHKRKKPLKPRQYQTSLGNTILVGRNNTQNDELTTRRANKNHYWFHVKDIPGSHVILETDQPSDEEIIEAATYAAYFSKYRQANNVPVDYTQVKHVKKPNGAKPGFVNYFEQKTVFVSPDAHLQA